MDTYWFKNIIDKLSLVFNSNKVNSPSYKSIQNTKIENKTKVTAKTVQIINQGLTDNEVKDLIISVVDEQLISLLLLVF